MASSIKVRARASDGVVTVKMLISHPMETGLRKDKKTGKPIPAHFIQEVVAKVNGNTVMTALWGGGVSQNPYLSFKYDGAAGDKLALSWVDNQGQSDSIDTTVS
jgi:sulfur-oxidizing protein SoxZ